MGWPSKKPMNEPQTGLTGCLCCKGNYPATRIMHQGPLCLEENAWKPWKNIETHWKKHIYIYIYTYIYTCIFVHQNHEKKHEKNERPKIPSDFLGCSSSERHPTVPPHGGVVGIAVVGRWDLRSHAHRKEASLGQRSRLPSSRTWA